MRELRHVRLGAPDVQIAFPQRLWLAFDETALQLLVDAGEARKTPILRWLLRPLFGWPAGAAFA